MLKFVTFVGTILFLVKIGQIANFAKFSTRKQVSQRYTKQNNKTFQNH